MSTPSTPRRPDTPETAGATPVQRSGSSSPATPTTATSRTTTGPAGDGRGDEFPRTLDEARTDIELTRQELGDTARELAHRLNVGDRAREEFHTRSEVLLRLMRANPAFLSAAGAAVALLLGGLVTWRLKR